MGGGERETGERRGREGNEMKIFASDEFFLFYGPQRAHSGNGNKSNDHKKRKKKKISKNERIKAKANLHIKRCLLTFIRKKLCYQEKFMASNRFSDSYDETACLANYQKPKTRIAK